MTPEPLTAEQLVEMYRACTEAGTIISEQITGIDAEGLFVYHVRTGKIERPGQGEAPG